jgi:hypothetical protein
MGISFTSTVPSTVKAALEDLMFFNEKQHEFYMDIQRSVETFGIPEIVELDGVLKVVTGKLECQCIFAVEDDTARLAGIAAFIIDSPASITLIHIAVLKEYSTGGDKASVHLANRLIARVVSSAKKIKGITKVRLAYSGDKDRLIELNI